MALRLAGNNEAIGRQRLKNFSLPATELPDMWQAVTRAVATARGRA